MNVNRQICKGRSLQKYVGKLVCQFSECILEILRPFYFPYSHICGFLNILHAWGGCLHNFLELLFIVEHKAFSELSLMVSRTVFSVELLWRCWRDGSLMKRSSTTRVALLATSLFFLSCLLTLILSPTEKFVPTLSAILGSKDLNVSMTTTPLGSTSLSLWFSNRWLWLRQLVFSDVCFRFSREEVANMSVLGRILFTDAVRIISLSWCTNGSPFSAATAACKQGV